MTPNKMITSLTAAMLMGAVLGFTTLATPAQAQTSVTESTQVITTVVDALIDFEGGYIVRRPNNGGRALKILDASIFPEAKIRALESSRDNRSAIKLVISGSTIVDIVQ